MRYPLRGSRVTHRSLSMAVHDDPNDVISECIRRYGIWEPAETDFLLDTLKPGDGFIDVGANIGYHSVLAADLVGREGRVIAYEPEAANFALLSENLGHLPQATLRNVAVSDHFGTASVHRSADNMGDHRLWGDGNVPTQPVDTVRLAPETIDARTTVKIDVQGWEAKVILGNREAIMRARAVIFEWFPRWVSVNGDVPMAIIDAFASGYRLRLLGAHTIEDITPADLARREPGLQVASGAAEDPAFLDLIAIKE